MNRIITAISSSLLFAQFMGDSAHAYIDRWSVTDSYTDIVAADCGDCEEDLGIIIACTGNGQPAKVTVNAAAAENGQDGAIAPVAFSIGGQQFVRQAKTVYFGKIGYTPVFELSPNDTLIPALQHGSVANISFNNGGGQIRLNGSRNALETFKAHCGWTAPGFKINQARSTGQNTQQAQAQKNTPQLPVFNQQTVPQQPTGQLPVFDQGQGQVLKQAQPTIFGLQPGHMHTQPNANGELWFTSASNSGRQLWYGIPETDSVAVSASCQPGSLQPVSLDLLVGTSNLGNGQQARMEFLFDGQNAFGLNGTAFIESEEYSGVRISVPMTAPFWHLLSSSNSVSFGIQGQSKIALPGAGKAGQFFVSQCRSASGQAHQIVQQQAQQQVIQQEPVLEQPVQQQSAPQQQIAQRPAAPQLPALQPTVQQTQQQQPALQQPVPQLPAPQVPQQASVELNRTFNVTCANGSSWAIRFENRQSRTVAILHPNLPQQLVLEPVATPSGQGYRNGPLTVYPEGDQLRSDHQGNVSSCPMR